MIYQAPPGLRGAHLQSLLATLPLRRHLVWRRVGASLGGTRSEVLDAGAGVRLLAEHTPPPVAGSGRLAVLIHGWEGSAASLYMVSLAARLVQDGFRVVRLNLRDHGDSHHLNPGIFHSCRLDEVLGALATLQDRFAGERLHLAGFSLGGNFALRVAALAPAAGLRLVKVVAVCPVLDPRHTLEALDGGLPMYRLYFLRKWRRSLERKRRAFPDLYEFGRLGRFRSLREMTGYFVSHFTGFPDLDAYLRGYAITGDRLAGLEIPADVLLADDDPVIPVADVAALAPAAALTVHRSAHGGHCGFMQGYRLQSWLDDFVARAFDT
ncbi:MAG: alpha/beta fold hydrolase [Gammaproteobacteria bacterium]|nr:MAG: alpha/beta fold hydrolase [Gammaproteobacteria bacterium]